MSLPLKSSRLGIYKLQKKKKETAEKLAVGVSTDFEYFVLKLRSNVSKLLEF